MKTITENIKTGAFKQIYLLYGEEKYLVLQFKNRLLAAMADPEDTMNVSRYAGKDCVVSEIAGQAVTMPFFADRRVIVIEDSGFFKDAKEADAVLAMLEELPDTTFLIFAEAEVDKRGKLFKYIQKNGYAADFARRTEADLRIWIASRLKKEGKQVTGHTVDLFLSRTGNDMELISNELEKLISYCLDRKVVTDEDVEAVCQNQVSVKIFDMIDAIGAGNRARALQMYEDLLFLREPAMRILFLITRQFHILVQIRDMSAQGMGSKMIAGELKLPEFAVRKNLKQAERFRYQQLKEAFAGCLQADEDIKSGKLNEQAAVELLILANTKKDQLK